MTRTQSIEGQLARFLEREALTLTVFGALGHNPTYRKSATDDDKHNFRKALRKHLKRQLEEYRTGLVDERQHVVNVEALSSELSGTHHKILIDGEFRVGSAQKALNLYLKYSWALRIIPEPPHCPIDSIVLKKIEKCPSSARCQICRNITWTKIRTIEEYLHFVDKAKAMAHAQGQSLACWELEAWPIAAS